MIEKIELSPRLKNILAYVIILTLATATLSYNLSQTPVHLNQDELAFALNAHSIANSLHDTSGAFLPFYFKHLYTFWATPIVTYLTAIFLLFLPLSETSIRLPSVFIGIISIFLIMLLTQRIYRNHLLTYIAGFLIATTPVFFINSRLLIDNLYPIPFVLLWLLFLKKFIDEKKWLPLFLSGLFLGIGIHSYHASKITMPIYFIATIIILIPEIKKSVRTYAVFLIGFILPIMIFIPWLVIYPDTLQSQVQYVGGGDETIDTEKGIWGVLNISRFSKIIIPSFPTYFSLKILFTTGDSSLIHSTHKTGAFLLPILILATFGALEIFFKQKDRFSKLILFGFLIYPIAPAIVNQPQRISRGLVVIPFLILLAIYGASYLLQSKDKRLKILLSILLITSTVQFGLFLNDYHGDYRTRSYGWFNNNIGGALEAGLQNMEIHQAQTLYIDQRIQFANQYSKFYQIKTDINVEQMQQLFNPDTTDISQLPAKSIIVVKSDHTPLQQDRSLVKLVGSAHEPDGNPSFYIYFRE